MNIRKAVRSLSPRLEHSSDNYDEFLHRGLGRDYGTSDDEKPVASKRRFTKQKKNERETSPFSQMTRDISTSSISLTSLDDDGEEETMTPTYTIVGAPAPLRREASLAVDDENGSKRLMDRSKSPSRFRAFAEAVGFSSTGSIDNIAASSKSSKDQDSSVLGDEKQKTLGSLDDLLNEIGSETEKQLQRKDDLKAIINQLLGVANARLKTDNKIGAALTMKKIHKLQQERVSVSQAIEFLNDQESEVTHQMSTMNQSKTNKQHKRSMETTTNNMYLSCKTELHRILKQNSTSSSTLSDEDLLNQVSLLAMPRSDQ